MNPFTHQLEAGDEIAIPGEPNKTYRVEYVNFSRAYCLPTYKVPVNIGNRTVDGEVTGPGINLAPMAAVTIIRDIRKQNTNQTSSNNERTTTMTTKTTKTTTPTTTEPADLTARRRKAMNDAIKGTSSEVRKLGTKKATDGQEQVTPAQTPAKARTKATDPVLGPLVARAEAAAAARKSQPKAEAGATVSTPASAPQPRLGCPRGADIDKVGLDCSGSGIEVPPHRYFSPGLDARFKGWMLKVERGVMGLDELPATVRASYDWSPVLSVDDAGQPTDEVQGWVAHQNYKGEDNPRYIELMAEGRVGAQEKPKEEAKQAAKATARGRGRKVKDEAGKGIEQAVVSPTIQ